MAKILLRHRYKKKEIFQTRKLVYEPYDLNERNMSYDTSSYFYQQSSQNHGLPSFMDSRGLAQWGRVEEKVV